MKKKKIYEEIEKRKLLEEPKKWLDRQVLLTASYFTASTIVNENEFNELLSWCKNNISKEAEGILMEYKNKRKRVIRKIADIFEI